jgi:mRNA interferase MazF
MSINQGEIWLVEFFPKVGNEITKLRPAIIISHDTIGKLPLKTVVPITNYKPSYANYPWMIKIEPSKINGLSKVLAIDCFQIKNFANELFSKKIGKIENILLQKIHQTVVKTFNPFYILQN